VIDSALVEKVHSAELGLSVYHQSDTVTEGWNDCLVHSWLSWSGHSDMEQLGTVV
jgi:hypothetical protein